MRDEGFYWIRIDGGMLEVAEWSCGLWWTTKASLLVDESGMVTVHSPRLEEP